MGARQKLNSAYMWGAIVIAGFIGFATGSFAAFLVAAAVLIGLSLYSGEIRLEPNGRRRRR